MHVVTCINGAWVIIVTSIAHRTYLGLWIEHSDVTEVWACAVDAGAIRCFVLGRQAKGRDEWDRNDHLDGWDADTRGLIRGIHGRTRVGTARKVEKKIVKGEGQHGEIVSSQISRIRGAPLGMYFVNGAAKALIAAIVETSNGRVDTRLQLAGVALAIASLHLLCTRSLLLWQSTLGAVLFVDTRRVLDTLKGPRTPERRRVITWCWRWRRR